MDPPPKSIKLWVALAIALLVLFLLYGFYKRMAASSGLKHDRSILHSLATALESYYIDWSEYPDRLERLVQVRDLIARNGVVVETSPYLNATLHSAFGAGDLPRYYRSQAGWFLWTPGPDDDFDIEVTSGFRDAFERYWSSDEFRAEDPTPPWLREHLYDPTNGSRSNGDLLRIRR